MASYPPSLQRMITRCTQPLCGAPSPTLFEFVTQELLAYLNRPGRSAQGLLKDFRDTTGSFYEGGASELIGDSDGEFLSWKRVPHWRNKAVAERLVSSAPRSTHDIMSVRGIGPDHFYDMFRITLLRMIDALGVCLPLFLWQGQDLLDNAYMVIDRQTSGHRFYVKVIHGIAIDLDSPDDMFVFPTSDMYDFAIAYPSRPYYDPEAQYSPSELTDHKFSPSFRFQVDVGQPPKIFPINVNTTRLSLRFEWPFGFSRHEARLAVVRQKPQYSTGKYTASLYNRGGNLCKDSGGSAGCKKFAAPRQDDLENPHLCSVSLTANRYPQSLDFYGLPDGVYKMLYYSDIGLGIPTVISTVRDLVLDGDTYWASGTLGHPLEIGRIRGVSDGQTVTLPSRAFVHGDIVRQYQQDTNDCGTFSLALAASYWSPFEYNTANRNGRWVSQHHGDWKIGTWQGHMSEKARLFGFNGAARSLDKDSTSRSEGLTVLKRWIAAGVPVIVNIDEKQDTSSTSGEHYKVLVGYDDEAQLGYYKKDGTEVFARGAVYFVNPGAKGLDEPDPTRNRPARQVVDGIADSRRENHESYQVAPIGNDVDSYRAFFYKWKCGGVPLATSDLWFLPFYPRYYRCLRCGTKHRVFSDVGQRHWRFMEELVSAV